MDQPARPEAPYLRGLERLLAVVQELSLVRTLDDVTTIVRSAARELTGADGATFVLREGEYCHYVDEDAITPLWKGRRFPMDQCVSGWAMKHREPVVIEDIAQDPRVPSEAYRPTFVKSLVMVPIRTLSPVGAIGTYSRDAASVWCSAGSRWRATVATSRSRTTCRAAACSPCACRRPRDRARDQSFRGAGSRSSKRGARFSVRAANDSIMSPAWNMPVCQVAM